MAELLASHSISVSQCGYNTVMDILKSGIAALVIPFSQGQENEQANRAERLQQLGLLKTATSENLSPNRFVDEIEQLLSFTPNPAGLDLDGAAQSSKLIYQQVFVNLSTPTMHHTKIMRAAHG